MDCHFVRIRKKVPLRVTPGMQAGIANPVWTEEMAGLANRHVSKSVTKTSKSNPEKPRPLNGALVD